MENFYDRTELLIGKDNMTKLKNSHILIFGLGGVGGSVLEALVRVGIENIDIVDNDTINITNLNRQIIANYENIGKKKTIVAKERAMAINPKINIVEYNLFYLPDNANCIDFSKYDYVIDAIDTITAKIDIIKKCQELNIPIISCMGTGNKLDATKFEICDIYSTKTCKLAKIMRKLCKENNINNLDVLYSTEERNNIIVPDNSTKHSPASIVYTPIIAGMLIAQHVILKIIKDNK
ncbi:MAG: tRNA threonylcarbamoyladenosine dehydratase [Clostridiales bacterium]|nr:tRNA threonylcarbamoyladenosine dehydratase [Clostridiales bacterium]